MNTVYTSKHRNVKILGYPTISLRYMDIRPSNIRVFQQTQNFIFDNNNRVSRKLLCSQANIMATQSLKTWS